MKHIFKRAFAIALTIVMVVSVMSTAIFATAAQDAQYPALVLDEEQIANITEGGKGAYFTFTPAVSGYYSFVSLENDDNDPLGRLYDADFNEIAANDDASNRNFAIHYYLTANATYYLWAGYYNNSIIGSFPVKVSEGQVEEIIAQPVELIEGIHGYDDTNWNDETQQDDHYFRYSWWSRVSYTVKFKNGDEVTGFGTDFNYNDEWFSINSNDNQSAKTPWTVGNTYEGTLTFFGVSATVQVSIVEFDPEEIFLDDINTAEISSPLEEVYFKFTPSASGNYRFESSADESIDPYAVLYDSNMKTLAENSYGSFNNFIVSQKLTEGETYYLKVTSQNIDHTGCVPFVISKAPTVVDIQVEPLTYTEKIEASYTEGFNQETSQYEFFFKYYWWHDISYTVTFDNHESVVAKGSGFEYNGKYYNIEYDDTQSPSNFWVAGEIYTPTFSVMDYTATASIGITEISAPELILNETTTATISAPGKKAFFLFVPEQSGFYSFESFDKGKDPYGHLYDASLQELAQNDDSNGLNFNISYDLEAGKTYYFAVRFTNNETTGSFPVKLSSAPRITSIKVEPMELIDHDTNIGSMADRWIPETDSWEPYFNYWWRNNLSYTITINGDTIKGTGSSFEYGGKWYPLNSSDNQYIEPWQLGGTYTAEVSALGFSAPVSISIIDTPIKSITFKPITLIGNLSGSWTYHFDENLGEVNWFYYEWESALSYTITFKDGTKTESNSRWFNYNGKTYRFEIENDQSYENQWISGRTYSPTLSILGYSTSVPIKITNGTIKSITFDPINLIEKADGYMYYDWDKITMQETSYFYYDWQRRLSYTITFTDRSKIKVKNGGFYNGDAWYSVPFYCEDPQNFQNQWKVGRTYSVPVTINGFKTNATVKVVPTPVQSITVKPLIITAQTNGNDYGFYRYDWKSAKDFSFTINYKNGAKETYTGGDDLIYKGTYYDVSYTDNQWNQPWLPGSTYTAKISVLGYEAPVSITISEHPVKNNIKYFVQNGTAVVTGLFGSGETFTIPENIDGYPVSAVMSLCGGEYSEIIIPDCVTMLSSNMLTDISGLKKLTLGAGVTALNNRIFQYANDLTEIVVAEDNPEYTSLEGIVYDKELTRIVAIPNAKTEKHIVPDTVTGVNTYFNGNYQFELDLTNSGTGYITEDGITYNKDKTVIYSCSPEKTGSYNMPNSVKIIADNAFSYSNLSEVTISNNVSDIVYYAFAESINLEKVVLPNNLKSISTRAFANCGRLSDVNIPAGLTTIGESAFENTALTSVQIPATVKTIGAAAFAWAPITSLTLSEGLVEIGALAFGGCDMTHVTFPNSLKTIGYGAFCETNIKTINLGTGVEYIGDGAFGDCWIESVNIPKNVKYIGMGAFAASNLKSVNFTEGITTLSDGAFSRTNLKSVDIPESVTDIGYKCFEDSKDLITIDLPNKLKSLDGLAFHGTAWYAKQPNGVVYIEKALYNYKGTMPARATVTVKNGTEIIADHSFINQENLKTIILPKSLKTIGYKAFTNCSGITDVYYYGSRADRDKLIVENANMELFDATWHYNYCPHSYSNACDRNCNLCGATRTVRHTYKDYLTRATLSKSGKIVKKCSICGTTYSTTTINYAKTIKLSTTSYTYNGKVKTPTVTVKDSKGKTISKSYYTVKYATGRKYVGKYKVTITFKGNYSGTKTLYFKINPPKTSIKKLTAAKKALNVSISKKSSQVTGYEIQYATSKKFTKAKTAKIKSYKTTKTTLKKLSAKKTYYVRIRTYKTVGNTTYYSGWSTVEYKKTK